MAVHHRAGHLARTRDVGTLVDDAARLLKLFAEAERLAVDPSGYRLDGGAGNWRLVAAEHPPDAGPGPPPAEPSPATLDLRLFATRSA